MTSWYWDGPRVSFRERFFHRNSNTKEYVRKKLLTHWKCVILLWVSLHHQILCGHRNAGCCTTVGESFGLTFGVHNDLCDWFALIFARGSQRGMRWDKSPTGIIVNMTYYWIMYVSTSPWNITGLCRTFNWIKPSRNDTFWYLNFKTLGIIKKTIIPNFDENWRNWRLNNCIDICVQPHIYRYNCLAYFYFVRSPISPLISELFPTRKTWNMINIALS